MREPWFWRQLDPKSRASAPVTRFLLTPVAATYQWAGKRRIDAAEPARISPPVVCIGNLTLGGAGKTPVVAAIRARLVRQSLRVGTLSRGYGGLERGPLRVDPSRHTADQVGDEPLMLATAGESWISRDRAAGGQAMAADGVDFVVMDDGHQNPSLGKDMSIVVIDASHPFGNGHVFPKGPLRETVAQGLARADAVVLMGDGPAPHALGDYGRPILRAQLEPYHALPPGDWIAFAGIGRPERFFDALRALPDVSLVESVAYPDHHRYAGHELSYLKDLAKKRDALLVTTEKDMMRLPADMRTQVHVHAVRVAFEDDDRLDALLAPLIARARR